MKSRARNAVAIARSTPMADKTRTDCDALADPDVPLSAPSEGLHR